MPLDTSSLSSTPPPYCGERIKSRKDARPPSLPPTHPHPASPRRRYQIYKSETNPCGILGLPPVSSDCPGRGFCVPAPHTVPVSFIPFCSAFCRWNRVPQGYVQLDPIPRPFSYGTVLLSFPARHFRIGPVLDFSHFICLPTTCIFCKLIDEFFYRHSFLNNRMIN